MRILIVDDEGALLTTLAANLELEGYEVVEAQNAAKALEIVKRESFDAIVSDIRMPGMNGVELFRAVKLLHPDTPVLLMTAFALETLVDEALHEGAYTVLPKPFDMQHLIEAVSLAVRRPSVLIVDQLPGEAETIAAALTAIGIPAEVPTSAQGALQDLTGRGIDVCVLDAQSAIAGGPDLVARVRALVPSLAVIAVTGAGAHDITRLLGMAATVMKRPVQPREIVGCIARTRSKKGHGTHVLEGKP